MADIRTCEQCGSLFEPRREHGRFCSARCRVAWNRDHVGDRPAEGSALGWSVSAMCDVTGRLRNARARDRGRAFAIISEAVWWVTIVDGTLVRYHPEIYDAVLGEHRPGERRLIEETLAGLRFVRNRMGRDLDHVEFIHLDARRSGAADGPVTAWKWTSVPEPAVAGWSVRGRAWELARYRAYEAELAGHTVGETFERAATFLRLAAARATSESEASAGADELGGLPRATRSRARG